MESTVTVPGKHADTEPNTPRPITDKGPHCQTLNITKFSKPLGAIRRLGESQWPFNDEVFRCFCVNMVQCSVKLGRIKVNLFY